MLDDGDEEAGGCEGVAIVVVCALVQRQHVQHLRDSSVALGLLISLQHWLFISFVAD